MKFSPFVIALLLLVTGIGTLHAQLQVVARFERHNFIPHEAVHLQVSVTNQSGRAITFGEHGGHSWLNVEVNDVRGRAISIGSEITTEPFILRNGETRVYEVSLLELADLTQPGDYRATVRVYYPPTDSFFETAPQRFQVRNGATVWERRIGLPLEIAPEGRHRDYEVIRSRIREFQALFVRVSDPDRHRYYAAFPLGSCMQDTVPSVAVEPDGKLHIVYQTTPHRWVYQCIDHMGNLEEDRLMDAALGRPELEVHTDGTVVMHGPPEVGSAGEGLPPVDGSPASLSDRPVGLDFGE